ncbi:hypothetical protein [Shewanella nanhaiensis]|uniref:EAL domain-containing protein n=1 Tax=Shewanella nanhaiensis TaxID=2864872 RepID=A0ABS7E321_9GAMM|nr:hypothetical protein [Shewanella nanhaiensis]MBW8184070.1 hypothetical protein [Shewanella nanhaiensis]
MHSLKISNKKPIINNIASPFLAIKDLNGCGFSYSTSPIVNRDLSLIGHEIELHEKHTKLNNYTTSKSIESIYEVLKYLGNNPYYIESKVLFIDFGPSIFFNLGLLKLIVLVNDILKKNNKTLVVEINNNNNSFYNKSVIKSMFYLRDNGVVIAKCNHAWWEQDFYKNKILTELIEVIKIPNPIKWKKHNYNYCIESRVNVFKDVIERLSKFKIVIDNVNNYEELSILSSFPINSYQCSFLLID